VSSLLHWTDTHTTTGSRTKNTKKLTPINKINKLATVKTTRTKTPAPAGRGQGHMPPGTSRGAPKGGVIFLRLEIYKNSVSSVEAVAWNDESCA